MPTDYNATLNLPKTDFPMRAGLPKREPEMLKSWEELDIYNEMLKKNEGKPLFNLHDAVDQAAPENAPQRTSFPYLSHPLQGAQ